MTHGWQPIRLSLRYPIPQPEDAPMMHRAPAPPSRPLFASPLAVRWADAFDRLGLTWSYRPQTFVLPGGGTYTPDFHVAGVGWVVVRPSVDALGDEEPALRRFARQLRRLVPAGSVARLFTVAAPTPTLAAAGRPHTVVEWLPEGLRGGGKRFGLHTFCAPDHRDLLQRYPDVYVDFADRALARAAALPVEPVQRLGATGYTAHGRPAA